MPFVIINLVYVGLAALVGSLGKHRKFGGWGYFFASLLFTPFIGLLLVLASDPRDPRVIAETKSVEVAQPVAVPAAVPMTNESVAMASSKN